MNVQYEVCLAEKTVGSVQVGQEGLYYKFVCTCRLTGSVIYELLAKCGEKEENLGILVPSGKYFGLIKRIPVKKLGQGSLSFQLKPRHNKLQGRFVPIRADEPFGYIQRLEQAYLACVDGHVGAMLREED